MSTCKVVCVTNRKLCSGSFFERVEQIAKAHPAAIILREKDLTAEEYGALAVKVKQICDTYGTTLVAHSFADIAGAIGVTSLHMPLDMLRKNKDIVKNFSVVGTSCHSVDDALKAREMGCSYIIAGHIFPTECKKGVPARGLDFLREVCAAVDIPVYAIGGINAQNAALAIGAGAAGMCSMSGFMQCPDVAAYLKELQNG